MSINGINNFSYGNYGFNQNKYYQNNMPYNNQGSIWGQMPPQMPPQQDPFQSNPFGQNPSEQQYNQKAMSPSQALNVLKNNFALADTAYSGEGANEKSDGLFSVNDLKSLVSQNGLPKELRDAANTLINNPAIFKATDQSQNSEDKRDGLVGQGDIDKYLEDYPTKNNKGFYC